MKLSNIEILADMILGAREDKGYSQRQLATMIGVSNSEISMIENAKRQKPRIEILKKLSEVLDLDFEEILEVMGYIDNNNDNDIYLLSEEERSFIVDAIEEKWSKNNYKNINKESIYNSLFVCETPSEYKIYKDIKDKFPAGYKRLKQVAELNEQKRQKFLELVDWFLKYESRDNK